MAVVLVMEFPSAGPFGAEAATAYDALAHIFPSIHSNSLMKLTASPRIVTVIFPSRLNVSGFILYISVVPFDI